MNFFNILNLITCVWKIGQLMVAGCRCNGKADTNLEEIVWQQLGLLAKFQIPLKNFGEIEKLANVTPQK